MTQEPKKLIYIAGPYRADTVNGIFNNIMEARKRMEWAWTHGYIPICPHMNSAFTDGLIPDEEILMGYLQVLGKCDVMMLFGNWQNSSGTMVERDFAIECGIPRMLDPFLPPYVVYDEASPIDPKIWGDMSLPESPIDPKIWGDMSLPEYGDKRRHHIK